VASVRARITVAYGAATLVALLGLGTVIGFARYNAARRDLVERGLETAGLAARIIERQGVQSVTLDTTATTVGGMLLPAVTRLLDALPGYILIADSTRTLYWSQPVATMYRQGFNPVLSSEDKARNSADVGRFQAVAFQTMPLASDTLLKLTSSATTLLVVASRFRDPLPGGVDRVVVGFPTHRLKAIVSETAGLTIVSAPVLILLASVISWSLAGWLLAPVGQMVNDVAAIRDGKSLHRRVLVEPEATSEFTRLGQTVNEMIGRLETSFGALRRFTADASHELRTPLTVIRADVERAMNTHDNPHEQAIALEEALQQVSRMTGLVESLLTLARADEGRFEVIREPVPLEPLVREVAETAAILGEEPGIAVRMPVMQPVTVLGDVERLRQLMLNLATNAVKYTQRGGSVEISLESRHDEAIITVKDDGIGIAAADLPFIFERFWRVDRARTRTEGAGAGLGLAISQWIAQAHDGRIDVLSRLGRGSTFTIVLPAAPRDISSSNTALTNS
jgi:two-component system OmpR family sensor kinase